MSRTGIRVFNSHDAIRVCDDKAVTYIALSGSNLKIPKTIFGALCYRNDLSVKKEWADLRFGDTVKFNGMEDYEAKRVQLLARRKTVSRKQFIKKAIGEEVKVNSNGETALEYFDSNIDNDALYCLDEPENSLSPKLQLKLVEILCKLLILISMILNL